jgi:phosphoserine aminotransferase
MADELIRDFREVMLIPDNFHIFLAQGGATLQFSAVPFNLAP